MVDVHVSGGIYHMPKTCVRLWMLLALTNMGVYLNKDVWSKVNLREEVWSRVSPVP